MKAARFEYRPAASVEAAAALLAGTADAKVLAGGQSLGPMLNLRLARPALLVDVTRIAALKRIAEEGSHLVLGAGVTHAMIEDGAIPAAVFPAAAMLQSVAGGIAYRAVRTRGTIGGSLAHADPAADWMTALMALEAELLLRGPKKSRVVPLAEFMLGAFTTVLEADEIIESVRVPKLSADARWGYYKVWRKTGEFAHALAAVVVDPTRRSARVVMGATDGAPIVLDGEAARLDPAGAVAAAAPGFDDYAIQVHAAAVRRAIARVYPS